MGGDAKNSRGKKSGGKGLSLRGGGGSDVAVAAAASMMLAPAVINNKYTKLLSLCKLVFETLLYNDLGSGVAITSLTTTATMTNTSDHKYEPSWTPMRARTSRQKCVVL